MSGGKASRQKGDRFERECVEKFRGAGITATRVPLSGAAGGVFGGDLQVQVKGETRKIECKIRKRAWADLYGWLEKDSPYALLIRTNNNPTLVVMPLERLIELAGGWNG